jgi:hypothetical protein
VLTSIIHIFIQQRRILFHTRLVNHQIVIEEDSFEEGLTDGLVAAGIK